MNQNDDEIPKRPKIKLKIQRISSFSLEQKEKIWQFYQPHHNITKTQFISRIENGLDKIGIFYLKNSKKIVGITGLRNRIVKTSSGKRYLTLYVGLSFVLKRYRGRNLIQRITLKTGIMGKLKHPFLPVYLWDDSISYKAYLLICKYVDEFYPSYNHKTPYYIREILNNLGERYYSSQYDPKSGCVIKNSQLLDVNIKEIEDLALKNDFIHYYIENNRGFYKGDGLLTIIPITVKNLYRYWKKIKLKEKKRKLEN